MPTARQLQEFEATVRAHPKWPRALCFGDSWFNYPLAPVDLHKQLRRGFRRTAFLNESKAGRESADVKELLPGLRRRYALDFVIINGENAAGGFGITEAILQELIEAVADAVHEAVGAHEASVRGVGEAAVGEGGQRAVVQIGRASCRERV